MGNCLSKMAPQLGAVMFSGSDSNDSFDVIPTRLFPWNERRQMLSISVHRFRHFSTFSERIVQPQRFCSMPRTFSMHGFEYFPSVQFSDLRLADCTATSIFDGKGMDAAIAGCCQTMVPKSEFITDLYAVTKREKRGR